MWLIILGFAIIIVLTISFSWTNAFGAPWLPTPMSMVHKMLTMSGVGPGVLVYDLGCGDGRIILTAARHYGARAVGIEIDPLRYLWCQLLITVLRLRGQVRIIYGDFFTQDLSEADVVTCYLLSNTNKRIQGKLKEELHPGARVVSHYFTFSDLQLLEKDDDKLYLYSPGKHNREK
jgi:SAM-dependent methyltransferase